jgi:uncharacterized protein
MSTEQKTQTPSARIVRCPSCGQGARYDQSNSHRPFCSQRCKTMDVAAWAEESYRIPAKESAPTDFEVEEHE